MFANDTAAKDLTIVRRSGDVRLPERLLAHFGQNVSQEHPRQLIRDKQGQVDDFPIHHIAWLADRQGQKKKVSQECLAQN